MTRSESESMDFTMKSLLILPLIVAPLLLSGCNTVKGFGEDISGSPTVDRCRRRCLATCDVDAELAHGLAIFCCYRTPD